MDAFSPHSMLYQTHHPLLFQFHPFAHSISDLPASSSSLTSVFSHLPVLQAETQMECVEAALKTGSRKDTGMKLNPQCFVEDWSALNVQNVAPSDDFFVDELLDFSHMEEPPEEEQQQQHKVESGSISPTPQDQSHETCNFTSTYSAKHDVESGPSSELSVPADDLADLEWLSHFVEDSFSEYSTAYPAGILTENPKSHHAEEGPEPQSPVSTQPCFKTPVPAKARSKRTRTGGRVWSLGSPSFTESSSSSTSSSSSSSPTSPWLIYANPALDQVSSGAKPPVKKPKKKPAPDSTGTGAAAAQAPRRCTHCGVHKTPQWRTGPLGAKTLCNACGVRYKSGRLLPEYRPACSPTFSSELHSNHHRKVLEMRRKKEVPAGVDSGLGFAPTPAVPTF